MGEKFKHILYSTKVFYGIICFVIMTGCTDSTRDVPDPDKNVSSSTIEDKSRKLTFQLSSDLSFDLSVEELVNYGRRVVFGTEDPLGVLARGEGPI